LLPDVNLNPVPVWILYEESVPSLRLKVVMNLDLPRYEVSLESTELCRRLHFESEVVQVVALLGDDVLVSIEFQGVPSRFQDGHFVSMTFFLVSVRIPRIDV
jgi:hypothetical protein